MRVCVSVSDWKSLAWSGGLTGSSELMTSQWEREAAGRGAAKRLVAHGDARYKRIHSRDREKERGWEEVSERKKEREMERKRETHKEKVGGSE